MKLLPYCCHFYCHLISVGPTTVLSLSFITINSFMRRSLSNRNQPIDLQSKSMDWCLYDSDLRHERVKVQFDHEILIKLRLHKVCYEDPGNKTD